MHNAVPAFCKNGALANASGGTQPGVAVTAANVKSDGAGTIGTDIFLCFTADATNGSLVEYVRFTPTATTATTTTATVGRVFVSSATSGAITSATTTCVGEVALPASAAANATTAVNVIDVPLNIRLPPGWTILVTNHSAPAANSAWKAITVSGDY